MVQKCNKAYIAFGANLSFEGKTPADIIFKAVNSLNERKIRVLSLSRLWHSPAWPDPKEPSYVNAVAVISTAIPPFMLLQTLRHVEQKFGRKRTIRNAPRTLDIDLLSYADVRLQTRRLTLPHPRIAERAFVLLPLLDVAHDWRMPGTGQTIDCMINNLTHSAKMNIFPLNHIKWL